MPELPEVETIRRGLIKSILNKRIVNVEIRLPKIVSLGPKTVSNKRASDQKTVTRFRKLVKGSQIRGIKRRAKILLIELTGDYTLLVHLKMTGQLIFAKKGEQKIVSIFNAPSTRREILPHMYTHVIFTFSDKSHLYFNDLRQFGYLRLVRDRELAQVKELQDYGPEPLTEKFTLEEFLKKAKKRGKLSVKQYLMDSKVVAGIGNIYSDEILYCAKLRPQRRLVTLRQAEWERLFACVPKVLREGLRFGGSSVGDFFRLDGTQGSYGARHRVYGKAGENCSVCGKMIEKLKLGGRTASYCPMCQK